MAYRLLCFASVVLFLFSISSGETSVNMCENRTTRIGDGDDNLELHASWPPLMSLTTNISKACSCLISTTYSSNLVNFRFSRDTEPAGGVCRENTYDEATLECAYYRTIVRSYTISNEKLRNYSGSCEDVSLIRLNITIHSFCGSNYTIQLRQTFYPDYVEFSQVTCSNTQRVITPSVTTPSPTAPKPTDVSKNYMSSTYSPKGNSSAGSVIEKNTSPPVDIGLIVGLVVGLGGGLLLLGAIILAVFIFRRRRAKPPPLTNANHNAPNETPYEPPVPYASVSYENLRNSTQLQTGILYDNQTPATDPLATETNQNYYSVQGYDNSAFHQSDAMPNNDQPSSEEVDHFVQEPHLINDTDTTVVENDLYE